MLYLYFDETGSGKTLKKLGLESNGIVSDFSKTACKEGCGVSENGVYQAIDDFGDSYYFRGTVDNNWVKFGNMSTSGASIWWRIIRINGDGSIRLIYAGTGSSVPQTTGPQTNAITSQTFNGTYNDNRFVGYQYASSSGTKRGHESPSNAYTQLMSWFNTNLSDEFANGAGQIDPSAGFCGDRSSSTSESTTWTEDMKESGGTGSTTTYYGAYLRLYSHKQPTLKCGTKGNKDADYYTYTGAKGIDSTSNGKIDGTKSLDYPVGLITADEVAFGGGSYGSNNTNYWLYTNSDYWTMSPVYFNGAGPYVFYVDSGGSLSNYDRVFITYGLRPVINLKADTAFTVDRPEELKGTSSNPYIVSN